MEIPLTPDLQTKLTRLAAQQGRPTEALVVEAVERMVNYDECFLRDVEDGLAAAGSWRTEGSRCSQENHQRAVSWLMRICWTDPAVGDFTHICD
jgi:predicted transcriptional regulator